MVFMVGKGTMKYLLTKVILLQVLIAFKHEPLFFFYHK